MISDEKLKLIFDEMEGMDKATILKKVSKEYHWAQRTAETYYYAWKSLYTHSNKCKPTEPIDINEKEPAQEVPKPKVSFVDAIIHTDQEIKKALKDTAEKIIETAADLQKEEIKVEDIKTPTKPVKFLPILLKAETFTYRFAAEGLTIEDGISDVITQDCINEQQEALKIWQQYYGGAVNE
jgi:hypothetical protein